MSNGKPKPTFYLGVLVIVIGLVTLALWRFGALGTGGEGGRFSVDELKEMTGLVPGSVPPFGKPILPFELYVDESILENDVIAFNAGSLSTSIIMRVDDYLRVAAPEVFRFST